MAIRMTAHVSRFMLTVVLALMLLALSLGVLAHRSSATDAAGGKYWMAGDKYWMAGGPPQRCCLMAQATPQGVALMAAAQPAHLNLMASVITPGIALMA